MGTPRATTILQHRQQQCSRTFNPANVVLSSGQVTKIRNLSFLGRRVKDTKFKICPLTESARARARRQRTKIEATMMTDRLMDDRFSVHSAKTAKRIKKNNSFGKKMSSSSSEGAAFAENAVGGVGPGASPSAAAAHHQEVLGDQQLLLLLQQQQLQPAGSAPAEDRKPMDVGAGAQGGGDGVRDDDDDNTSPSSSTITSSSSSSSSSAASTNEYPRALPLKGQRQQPPPSQIPNQHKVRVGVRIRPLTNREAGEGGTDAYLKITSNQVSLGNKRSFTFDEVFDPSTTQHELYGRIKSGLFGPFWDGYNATVRANKIHI
jgi:hypothetical protein